MLTGVAAGLAAVALWGLVFVAPQIAAGWSAIDLTAGRFLVYGVWSLTLMMWSTLARSRSGSQAVWPHAGQALAALGMSVLGFTGYYLLLVLAIRDAGVEVPSLIIGTIPIWMMLLGRPAGLRMERLLPGLLMTLLGLALMVQASLALADAASGDRVLLLHFKRGVALAVCAMTLWTVFGLINSAWLKRHPEVSAVTWTNWLGVATGAGALVLWSVSGSDLKVLLALPNRAQAAMLCIATGVGSAWLATLLWNYASQRLSASLCGQLIVGETLFALAYSFVWHSQKPTLLQWLASSFFVGGIVATMWAHRDRELSHDHRPPLTNRNLNRKRQ